MHFLRYFLLLISLLTAQSSCIVPRYEQCGGKKWTGCTVCEEGFGCDYSAGPDKYWYGCRQCSNYPNAEGCTLETKSPTESPTAVPTFTEAPSFPITNTPSAVPTTGKPTEVPTAGPTLPSSLPTSVPSMPTSPPTKASFGLFADNGNSSVYYYNKFMSTVSGLAEGHGPSCPSKYPSRKYAGSSGGAAGGIVSESQAYAMILSAFQKNVTEAELYKNGWRCMADGSENVGYTFDGGGQNGATCGSGAIIDQRVSICDNTKSHLSLGNSLKGCCNAYAMGNKTGYVSPWKYKNGQPSCGSAPDADEDAIFGIIYAAEQSGDSSDIKYAVEAILAFILQLTGYGVEQDTKVVNGKSYNIVKLGSCWGGFVPVGGGGCFNPSYFAPGHYHLFQEYLILRGPTALAGTGFENRIDEFVGVIDDVISTSYKIVEEVTCDNGWMPNWVSLSSEPEDLPWEGLGYACSGSGTPAKNFGAEAVRLVWRYGIDYQFYGDARAKVALNKIAAPLVKEIVKCLDDPIYGGYDYPSIISACEPLKNGFKRGSCELSSIPIDQGFMFGPVVSSLIAPLDPSYGVSIEDQQRAINAVAEYVYDKTDFTGYYQTAQMAIGMSLFEGHLRKPFFTR